jgi:hypothetical protein
VQIDLRVIRNTAEAALTVALSAQLVAPAITFKTMSRGGGLQIVGILCSWTVGARGKCPLDASHNSSAQGIVRHKITATTFSQLLALTNSLEFNDL